MVLVQPIAWVVSLGLLLAALLLLRRSLGGEVRSRLGPAGAVTLVRLVLTCAVAGLVAQSLVAPTSRTVVCVLAGVALPLDALDGYVARRTRTASRVGARFDMETDALLILALSVYVASWVGWWVLLIGLARYLLLGAETVCPRVQGSVRPRLWRKAVAALQAITLYAVATGLLNRRVSTVLLAGALALLVASFASEVVERRVAPAAGVDPPADRPRWLVVAGATGVSALAVVVLWAALLVPDRTRDLTPALLVRVPVEGIVLVAAVLLLPNRAGRPLAWAFGSAAGVLLVLKVVNLGFILVLNRPFSLVGDWSFLGSAVGVLSDSVGHGWAVSIAVALCCAVVAVLVLVPLATLRTCRLARRHPRPAAGALIALAAVVLLPAALPGAGLLSASSAELAVGEVRAVRADLHDRTVFAAEIKTDRLAATPDRQFLQRLRGKDVLLLFVESYGRSAVQDSSFAPGVDSVLDAGNRRLQRAGYRSRTAFLTSPTFGAGSWLAHSTLQSGLWVDSELRYDELLAARRLTLSSAFHDAGWRTVLDDPANTRPWPEGASFYGVDKIYDSGDVGYQGPAFGYATMPDQYTLSWFAQHELAPEDRAPVMAEIDLVSSHHPWAPLPHLVPWRQVGDGSVFDGMPERGSTAADVFSAPQKVQAAYGQSIQYTLRTVVSFLTRSTDRNLVVVMLGDHQPHHYVSGSDPGYDVPVSVISRDRAVVRRVSAWGWRPGIHPQLHAPVWRMDAFRDRFLTTFSTAPGSG